MDKKIGKKTKCKIHQWKDNKTNTSCIKCGIKAKVMLVMEDDI